MDDGSLIEYVQTFPNLYDRRRSDFKDKEKSGQSWMQISRLMKYSVEDCMSRWKYLREKYTRLRKGGPSGSEAAQEWEYFKCMLWLEPYIQKRNTKTSISNIVPLVNGNEATQATEVESFFDESQTSINDSQVMDIAVDEVKNFSQSLMTSSRASPDVEVTFVTETPYKRKRPNKDEGAPLVAPVATSLNSIGAAMSTLVRQNEGKNSLDENVLFGQSVTAFLQNKKGGKKKNNFKKTVFNLMMEFSDSD